LENKLYIGGLPYSVDDSQLSALLAQFGTVTSARVILDRMTNTSRGFGFVEMSSVEEAQRAIAELNGKDFMGRTLTVNEAKPQQPRRDRGGGRGYGGGRR
jgi:RNA recognition motif-containing protein